MTHIDTVTASYSAFTTADRDLIESLLTGDIGVPEADSPLLTPTGLLDTHKVRPPLPLPAALAWSLERHSCTWLNSMTSNTHPARVSGFVIQAQRITVMDLEQGILDCPAASALTEVPWSTIHC